MLKIGLLSDTHAWWDDKYMEYFSECDEIWHAGDIGSDTLAARLAALKPLRAVWQHRRAIASAAISAGRSFQS